MKGMEKGESERARTTFEDWVARRYERAAYARAMRHHYQHHHLHRNSYHRRHRRRRHHHQHHLHFCLLDQSTPCNAACRPPRDNCAHVRTWCAYSRSLSFSFFLRDSTTRQNRPQRRDRNIADKKNKRGTKEGRTGASPRGSESPLEAIYFGGG